MNTESEKRPTEMPDAHRTDSDDLVRLNIAARVLGVATKTVKKYCRCGKLRCRQLPSGHWRVYQSSLESAYRELETYPK